MVCGGRNNREVGLVGAAVGERDKTEKRGKDNIESPDENDGRRNDA